jgi:hypothetical protein
MASRFNRETKTNSLPDRPKADFWSAAGAIFAQQNRIPRLTRAAQHGPAPLSLAQERLWMLERSEQGAPYYHVPLTWQISGELNIPALEKALNYLVQRHEILRTRFPLCDSSPAQQVRELDFKLNVVDAPASGGGSGREELLRKAKEFVCAPFDRLRVVLFRAALYRRGEQDYWLVVVVHQMVFDGASMRIFSRELAESYPAFCESRTPELDPLPVRYADFALWQRQCQNGELTDAAASFWSAHLQKQYEPLLFPIDHPRRNIGTTSGALLPVHL